MRRPALPNLLIIGSMKCGTTSLHSYLAGHREVSMSEPKELDFFALQGNWSRGRSWYEGNFDATRRVRGEASPIYTAFPYVRGVPERAAELVPDAKLVYLIRDPIDRIVSHYLHRVTAGRERRSFDRVVEAAAEDLEVNGREPERLRDVTGYLARSMYFRQLERWLAHFPDSRVMVVEQDGLRLRRRATLSALAEFLEIEDSFDPGSTSADRNRTEDKRLVSSFGARVRKHGGRRLAQSLPGPLRRPLVRSFTQTFDHVPERPRPTVAQRDRLAELLGPDAEALRGHTGLELGNWGI